MRKILYRVSILLITIIFISCPSPFKLPETSKRYFQKKAVNTIPERLIVNEDSEIEVSFQYFYEVEENKYEQSFNNTGKFYYESHESDVLIQPLPNPTLGSSKLIDGVDYFVFEKKEINGDECSVLKFKYKFEKKGIYYIWVDNEKFEWEVFDDSSE